MPKSVQLRADLAQLQARARLRVGERMRLGLGACAHFGRAERGARGIQLAPLGLEGERLDARAFLGERRGAFVGLRADAFRALGTRLGLRPRFRRGDGAALLVGAPLRELGRLRLDAGTCRGPLVERLVRGLAGA